MRDDLPPKLFFRIGEVAGLVGVEPHVLRYWEREFRSIRPTKSAKGQRVYSRKDVENLLRVRDLLYRDGFTIAGAKKKLQVGSDSVAPASEAAPPSSSKQSNGNMPAAVLVEPHDEHDEHANEHANEHIASVMQSATAATEALASSASSIATTPMAPRVREKLVALRSEIESFLAELDPPSPHHHKTKS